MLCGLTCSVVKDHICICIMMCGLTTAVLMWVVALLVMSLILYTSQGPTHYRMSTQGRYRLQVLVHAKVTPCVRDKHNGHALLAVHTAPLLKWGLMGMSIQQGLGCPVVSSVVDCISCRWGERAVRAAGFLLTCPEGTPTTYILEYCLAMLE